MTVKKYYIKKDSVEYELHSFSHKKENTTTIDTTDLSLARDHDSIFNIGDDVSVGYYNGSDVFVREFNGDITSKQVNEELIIAMESYDGRVYRTEYITEVHENKTIEYIMEHLITTYTDLTYASTNTTGITIERFVINTETVGEVITRILKSLDWQTRVDNDKNFYFEPSGDVASSVVLSNGVNAFVQGDWKETPNRLTNSCTVIGDKAKFNTNKTFSASASQTNFEVTYKITGNVRVTVDGTEKVGGISGSSGTYDYSIDSEQKLIIFESGLTGGEEVIVYYEYELPIKITARNESSIDAYGTFPKKVTDDTLKTTSDARKLAKKIVSIYGSPITSGTLRVSWDEDIDVGETVQIIDSFNSIDSSFVVVDMTKSYPSGDKIISVGIEEIMTLDINKDINDRIKRLEADKDNSDILQKYLTFPEKINVVSTPGRIRTRTRDTSTDSIWGIATWGTDDWDATYDNEMVITSVRNQNKTMNERFNFTTYKDTSSTTATWNTTDEKVTFTSGQIAQSLSVAFDDGTITTATLTSTESYGSFDYEMTADGTNWETVTNAVSHNFTNTGTDLRWRATENDSSTGEITNIKIIYE